MCLSTVYLEKIDPSAIILDEASAIRCINNTIEASTIFGEKKSLEGYYVAEADLLKHYVIIKKAEKADA